LHSNRLSRYEAALWRQAGRILFALDALDRRKQKEDALPVLNKEDGTGEIIQFARIECL
jgi:hypothetical protein